MEHIKSKRPFVKICAYCQGINKPQMSNFSTGIDSKVKDEMKQVDAHVKSKSDELTFSHGICEPHLIQTLQEIPGMTKERINSMVSKLTDSAPCLLNNDQLRHSYMRGIFTPEQVKQVQQSNQHLTERFKKLAGI